MQSRFNVKTLPKYIHAFSSLFTGRDDAWGSLAGGCVKEKLTIDHFRRHLAGQQSLGVYPLRTNSTCRWGAIDIDFNDLKAALDVIENLRSIGLISGVYLEKSKSKGFHIFIFVSDWVSAKILRQIMRYSVFSAGLPDSIELFPKQDTLEGIHYGNYLNLPYFGGNNHEGRRMIIDLDSSSPIPFKQWLDNVRVFPSSNIELLLKNISNLPEQHKNNPVISSVTSHPINVGERRPTIVKLAGYLRYRGISEDIAVTLITAWALQSFVEPLDKDEIVKHIRGIYQRYGAVEIPSALVLSDIPSQLKQQIESVWK